MAEDSCQEVSNKKKNNGVIESDDEIKHIDASKESIDIDVKTPHRGINISPTIKSYPVRVFNEVFIFIRYIYIYIYIYFCYPVKFTASR